MAAPYLVELSGNLRMEFLKDGAHTLLVPIPEEIAALIGRIVIQWGAFELHMNSAIEAMLSAASYEEMGWQRQGFPKRKNLFKVAARRYLLSRGPGPERIEDIDRIAAEAARIHWQRNVVAHGHYDAASKPLEPHGRMAQWAAYGAHKGRKVEIPLDPYYLDKLRHEIGHLGGSLLALLIAWGGASTGLNLLVEDREILRGPGEGPLPLAPTQGTPKHPPQS